MGSAAFCGGLAACQVPVLYESLSIRIAGGAVIAGAYDLLTMREFLRIRNDEARSKCTKAHPEGCHLTDLREKSKRCVKWETLPPKP